MGALFGSLHRLPDPSVLRAQEGHSPVLFQIIYVTLGPGKIAFQPSDVRRAVVTE
jgi:hypothetical protein